MIWHCREQITETMINYFHLLLMTLMNSAIWCQWGWIDKSLCASWWTWLNLCACCFCSHVTLDLQLQHILQERTCCARNKSFCYRMAEPRTALITSHEHHILIRKHTLHNITSEFILLDIKDKSHCEQLKSHPPFQRSSWTRQLIFSSRFSFICVSKSWNIKMSIIKQSLCLQDGRDWAPR